MGVDPTFVAAHGYLVPLDQFHTICALARKQTQEIKQNEEVAESKVEAEKQKAAGQPNAPTRKRKREADASTEEKQFSHTTEVTDLPVTPNRRWYGLAKDEENDIMIFEDTYTSDKVGTLVQGAYGATDPHVFIYWKPNVFGLKAWACQAFGSIANDEMAVALADSGIAAGDVPIQKKWINEWFAKGGLTPTQTAPSVFYQQLGQALAKTFPGVAQPEKAGFGKWLVSHYN